MNYKDIDIMSCKNLFEEDTFVLLDVRTPEEFNSGHIRGAKNISFYEANFQNSIGTFDKRKKYIVYCRLGNISRQAMFLMRDLGFEEVYNLSGGIISWHEHGYYIEN